MTRRELEALGMSDEELSRLYADVQPVPADRDQVLRSADPDTADAQAQRRRWFDGAMAYAYRERSGTIHG